jgi:hypothetical protein
MYFYDFTSPFPSHNFRPYTHTHTHTHTQHLILYFNYKIYYTLMGFPYFNLTDVAKMDEMEVLVIAQEGQA